MAKFFQDKFQVAKILGEGKSLSMTAMLEEMTADGERNTGERSGEMSNYGCYCSPHDAFAQPEKWLGTGKPVDEIDTLCRGLYWGLKCLNWEYDGKCSSNTPYKWTVDDKGKIQCLDKKDTCPGDLCRMDLDFVENFNSLSVNWNPKFYIENGFNRWKQCGKSQTPGKDKYGSNGGDSVYQNSGNSGHGQCCGKSINSVIYKPERMECCPDGRVKQIGTCY